MTRSPLRHLSAAFGLALLLAGLSACAGGEAQERGPVVLAAASLQEAMIEAADAWEAQGNAPPVLSFAGTSSLARQVEAGAPADIFVSADEQWMDWLEQRGLIRADTRQDLLANRIVLIAPADSGAPRWRRSDSLAEIVGDARIAVADTAAVPAGRYAKMALQHVGAWEALEPRLVPAENVRAALALVERGEVPFGIVYATDQRASSAVTLLGRFPEGATPPILYPAALLAESDQSQAAAFLAFLHNEEAQAIFRRHGFGMAP